VQSRAFIRTLSACLTVLAGGALAPAPAGASTLVATNASDRGPGSLRDTITKAKDGDTIAFVSSLAGGSLCP
jgi:hypothetical protein